MVVFSLITGKGHFSPPLHYCLEFYLRSSLCIPKNFPWCFPQSSYNYSWFPFLSFPQLELTDSSCSPPPFPSLLHTPLLPSFSLQHSQFPQKILSISFLWEDPSKFHLWFSMLPSFSGVVESNMFILSFISNIFNWVRTYHIFLSGSGLPHSMFFFSISVHLSSNSKMSLLFIFLTSE